MVHLHTAECAPLSGGIVCIIPGPQKMLHRQTDRVRWCFDCRGRYAHDIVIYGDEEPSYYDPIVVRECARCGHDRTDFPGTRW